MRFLLVLGVALSSAACVQTNGLDREDREFRRVEYLDAVFMPAAKACSQAGGFMIFDDPTSSSDRPAHLSYIDMRMAVARGCAGI